jgi:hypothetical protein
MKQGEAPGWRHAQSLEASLEESSCLVLSSLFLLQRTRPPPILIYLEVEASGETPETRDGA